FQWVLREITSEGGDGSVCHASFVDGLNDDEVEALFRAARSRDYEEIAEAARGALKTPTRGELARLRRRVADVAAIDFFGSPTRAAVDELLERLEVRLRAAAPKAGELRFDMFEAEFTHEGDRCTFETLVARFGLQADPALRVVAEIVHDIDVKDAKFARVEAA